jgi:hypothetical protein
VRHAVAAPGTRARAHHAFQRLGAGLNISARIASNRPALYRLPPTGKAQRGMWGGCATEARDTRRLTAGSV